MNMVPLPQLQDFRCIQYYSDNSWSLPVKHFMFASFFTWDIKEFKTVNLTTPEIIKAKFNDQYFLGKAGYIFRQRNPQGPIRKQYLSRSTNRKRPCDIFLPIREQHLTSRQWERRKLLVLNREPRIVSSRFAPTEFGSSLRLALTKGYGGAMSVLMLESAAKASASMLGTASNYRQSQTFTKVCLDHGAMINESCTPIPHSMRSDVDLHAASPIAQNKQGRVQDLGRGFCPISIIQSPQTSNFAASKQLSILQCNINGLCSTATKIKLEEIMEIAEKQKIQIIALQETKLNEKYNLKYKNYNILRKDRNKEGSGLAFLIKNLYYEDIAINIPNTSDLEAQEISTKTKTSSIKEKFWNFKKANWNLYQQNTNEDFRKAPTRIKDLEQNWISLKNTIIKAAKLKKRPERLSMTVKNVTSTRNIFHEKINMKELDYALENTDLNKTPGPDGIHGQMISNLGKNGKEKLLDIFNNSWKTGKLP
ncbi:hypothetical protein LAZ67_2001852 [Cordylochernes scorpioides]|uniref:Endonuclease/exonuclease/phosphatase domain-containing protein n=1 Tax=Cordylochernes scorpioides TaxID=51811 RepID=A0ABY6K1U4_9ARAC|nr:hypothetical protein LAZ67_2001852 [Cordylochernes scorpioides]